MVGNPTWIGLFFKELSWVLVLHSHFPNSDPTEIRLLWKVSVMLTGTMGV